MSQSAPFISIPVRCSVQCSSSSHTMSHDVTQAPSAPSALIRPLSSSIKALDGTTAFNLARIGRFKTPISGLSIEPAASVPYVDILKSTPPPTSTSSRFDRFRDSPPSSPKRGASRQPPAIDIQANTSQVKAEVIGLAATRNNALTLVTNFNPSWADPFELIAQACVHPRFTTYSL